MSEDGVCQCIQYCKLNSKYFILCFEIDLSGSKIQKTHYVNHFSTI